MQINSIQISKYQKQNMIITNNEGNSILQMYFINQQTKEKWDGAMRILRLSLQILFEKKKANMIRQILRNISRCKLFDWRGKLDLQLSYSTIYNLRKNAIYL